MCENLDWNVGRLLKKLSELGIAENTIVIYFSDNGPNGWRWNSGMRGRKGSTDEGGVRSPFFIRWPGKIKPGTTISHISGAIDLLPTLADMAGINIIGNKKLDGISIKPLFLGSEPSWSERMYFNAWKGQVSVRTQKYRLDAVGRLYDMDADPGQKKDISEEHPDIKAQLVKAVNNWKKETMSGINNRPFPVGHPGSKVTYLPARDGKPHGNITRSNRYPNCSFFTNWLSTNDSISWDVEVLTAGKYEAQVYYTCKQENVGVNLELSFANSKTQGKITEAYDTALIGAKQDRVPRIESYVKEFKSMQLGILNMPQAHDTLLLRAKDIPGKQAIDVRYVVLTRIKN
jgi:hypothetical protein